jgi:hypothetical protein
MLGWNIAMIGVSHAHHLAHFTSEIMNAPSGNSIHGNENSHLKRGVYYRSIVYCILYRDLRLLNQSPN